MKARDDWWWKILDVGRTSKLEINATWDDDGYRRVHFDGDQDDLGRELDGHVSDFRAMMRHMYPDLPLYPAGSAVFCPLTGCAGHPVEHFR